MKTKIAAILLVVSVISCKEPYIPPNGSLEKPLLVVEANLDPAGTTSITLSRTTNLNDPAVIRTESNAVVTVEDKNNTVFSLTNRGNGLYTGNLSLILNNEYRLRIKNLGKEYLSDWVKTIFNPPLDSISWKEEEDGVHIYVNTNDPTHAAKYFRWDYNETWELRTRYFSEYIYAGGGMLRRRNFPSEDVSICWKFSPSTGIFLANSTRLQSGIISQMPIVFIPRGDEKLLVRYSIIAKQYALEEDAYNFFEIMKKNTEDIGSFFGPLPSELKGNIHCLTNPDEPVIGFVTSSAATQKRIFIDATQVSNWLSYYGCEELFVANHPDSIAQVASGGWVPVYFSQPINKYFFTTPYCADCKSRGGINVRPTYW